MIKLSTSTAAWQLIWQVNTQGLGKKKNTFFFFYKRREKPRHFEIIENFPIDFSDTGSWTVFG